MRKSVPLVWVIPNYFRNPNERIIAGSLASFLHTDMKQIILTTARITRHINAAIGTIIVQQRMIVTRARSVSTTPSAMFCLAWKVA